MCIGWREFEGPGRVEPEDTPIVGRRGVGIGLWIWGPVIEGFRGVGWAEKDGRFGKDGAEVLLPGIGEGGIVGN